MNGTRLLPHDHITYNVPCRIGSGIIIGASMLYAHLLLNVCPRYSFAEIGTPQLNLENGLVSLLRKRKRHRNHRFNFDGHVADNSWIISVLFHSGLRGIYKRRGTR
jgi:hypothetical protein